MSERHADGHAKLIADVAHLEDLLSEPTEGVIETLRKTPGDFLLLGAGGKMGPSLAHMIRRGLDQLGSRQRVIAVARWSSSSLLEQLQSWGIETIQADLLDDMALAKLPSTDNVFIMTGMKFGSTGQEALTWAMNVYLPATLCRRFQRSRIVAFSSGNVYGLTPLAGGGPVESDPLKPVGEYAMSCLGRERMYEYWSQALSIPMVVLRLNYATEMRYGVLVDLGNAVAAGATIPLNMGYVNVIWQGDANAMAIQAFDHVCSPPFVLNIAGPEILSVREVCERFGLSPKFSGIEAKDALLNNAALSHRLFGRPRFKADQLLDWTADWIKRGGPFHNKPTHFQSREGKF